jgi:uncharacterized FlaG/YvyC family protein
MVIDAVSQSSPVAAAPPSGAPRPAGDSLAAGRRPPGDTSGATLDRELLRERVAEESRRFEQLDQSLTFRLHEDTQQLMVQVVDRRTGKVLRETPPKEFLDLTARLREMIGFFLDETR